MVWMVVPAVFPVTVTTVVQLTPSVLTWMLKSRVFDAGLSPPASACLTTKRATVLVAPEVFRVFLPLIRR